MLLNFLVFSFLLNGTQFGNRLKNYYFFFVWINEIYLQIIWISLGIQLQLVAIIHCFNKCYCRTELSPPKILVYINRISYELISYKFNFESTYQYWSSPSISSPINAFTYWMVDSKYGGFACGKNWREERFKMMQSIAKDSNIL